MTKTRFKISVAICTWNRAGLLDQTLAQMRCLDIPNDVDWELLVVNNNCTDNTDEVIAAHSEHLPIRRLWEPRPGQSNARNCAVSAAQGELILWTDDDVLVDPSWLVAYNNVAAQYPTASFFGGRILPWIEGDAPRWLVENWRVVESAFAVRDLGDRPLQFSPGVVPYGANFAVRTEVQRQYLYDPRLGHRPNLLMGGDETTVVQHMLADGLQGWWVPEASVRHFIPNSRQSTRFLMDYYDGHGAYLAFTDRNVFGVHWFGKPRWLWRQTIVSGLRYYTRRPWVRPQTWLQDLRMYAKSRGQLRHYRAEKPSCARPDPMS